VLFEFNSWCQVGFNGINPKDFIEWILINFSHVYMLRRTSDNGYLKRLQPSEAVSFLYTNMVEDHLCTDLLVTNFAERLALSPSGLRSKLNIVVAERDAAVAQKDIAIAERDAVMAEKDAVMAERNAAIAERDTVIAERDAAIPGFRRLLRRGNWVG
jgi:hypothetical protein